jgi:hypothetical protein
MTPGEVDISRRWLKAVRDETEALKAPEREPKRGSSAVLKLTKDKRIEWSEDKEDYKDVLDTYNYGLSRGRSVLNLPGSHTLTTKK